MQKGRDHKMQPCQEVVIIQRPRIGRNNGTTREYLILFFPSVVTKMLALHGIFEAEKRPAKVTTDQALAK